jgi:MFS family permease
VLSERASARVFQLVALALALAALSRLVPVVAAQLAAPFDLISEGPHMCTVQAIMRGLDIYDPRSFLDLPFYMTPYSPLFHVLVAALPQSAANPFLTGRVLAIVFMFGAAAALLGAAGPRRGALALLAIGTFFLIRPVTLTTAYLRSDGMAVCCAAWAVVVAWRSHSRGGAAAAGALCALAAAAKQSFLAPGIACLLWFALAQRRRLGAFLLGGIATGAALALAATAYWGTKFWIAMTIPVTDYPRDMESFFIHWRMMFAQPVFVVLVGGALIVTAALLVARPREALATPFLLYVLFAWPLQTWVMTGIGAENHDLIEPVLATFLWIVVASSRDGSTPRLDWRWGLGLAALAVAVALELRNPDPATYSATTPAKTARYVEAREAMRQALAARGLDHGAMLNLKNSQVVHDYAGDFTINDVWMYITVLWNTRPETVDRLVAAIEAERFDGIFVAPGVLSAERETGNSPWARISHAVFAHYRVSLRGAEVNVLTRQSAPAN